MIFLSQLYIRLKYVELAYQKQLLYDDKDKNLIVTSKHVDVLSKLNSDATKPPITVAKRKTVDSEFDIYGIEISEMTNGTLIRLEAAREINMFRSSIHNGKLFLFISGATVDPKLLSKFKPAGVVKSINVKDVRGNKQIEFSLSGGTVISDSMHSSTKDVDTDDILISIQNNALEKYSKDVENR